MSESIILIVNDDGVESARLARLHDGLQGLGCRVVVAPERDCSGMGYAISRPSRLHCEEVAPHWWKVRGTPSDCAALGVLRLCPRIPDLVIAGTNSDYNLGVDILHSGTIGAAAAAYLLGCSAMAVSAGPTADLTAVAVVVRSLARDLLASAGHRFVNINVPAGLGPEDILDRVRPTRLETGGYELSVKEVDGEDGPYYTIEGVRRRKSSPDADAWAVEHGFVSVTSLRTYDLSRFVTPVRQLAHDE